MISSIIRARFLKLRFGTIRVREKRNDKESMICLTPKPSQSFFVYCIQSKEKHFSGKKLFNGKGG